MTDSQEEQETLCDVIRRHATTRPGAPALVAEGRAPLSYGGLVGLMEQVREALNRMGLGRGDRVAVVHPGGPAMAAAIAGIWNGATVVPMNPDYTVGEFTIHMRDLGVKALAVATDDPTPARKAALYLGLPVAEIVETDTATTGMIALQSDITGTPVRPGPARPEDVAMVLTTSGTTSRSKIVPIRHRQLAAMAVHIAGLFELTPADRCLNLMPMFHGHGLYTSLAATLFSGGSLIDLPRFSADDFFRLLATLGVTWYGGSYTFQHAIAAQAPRYKDAIAASKLRFARSGSGHLDWEIIEQLERIFGVPVIQTYSMTEAGRLTGNPLPPRIRKKGTVGVTAGGEIAVMGPDGSFLPAGVRGEIVTRGPHVFDGYESDPEANAAAFVDGWFRTGDEGFFDDDGYLTLTGRIKEIINRGGEKISPPEVEEALMRHPDVAVAVVFPVPHVTLGQDVAAAVVAAKGAVLTDEILVNHLRGRIAKFKIPRRFVFVGAIPKGATGKFERGRLAAAFGLERPAAIRRERPEDRSRRASRLEAMLQTVWADVLGLDHVGLDDDFFVLGGDSLQAVELFLRIEREVGTRLPRSALFEAATVAKMAAHIEASIPPRCLVPIQPSGSRPPFFCIHDGNGQVLNYRELAHHLGNDQPFYGVQCHGLDGKEVPFIRIDEMAAHYIAEIRKIEPAGPYFIGGYSFGGRVAYVMAQQLYEVGESVALLALIDSYCHSGQRRIGFRRWLSRHSRRLMSQRARDIPAYVGLRGRNLAEMAFMAMRRKIFAALWNYFERRGREIPHFLRRPVLTNDMIRRAYDAKPYGGTATLFKAELYAWNHPDAHEGWRDLVKGGLDVRPISGRHFEILKPPHVRGLAHELSAALERAQPDVVEPAQLLEKMS